MRAEILSIGSEMTSGQNFDTNGPWLSRALAELGIATAFRTTIGDDPEDNRQVFEAASHRADVVISTGGLGPTQDDLTREILARLAGVELVFHEESWRKIQEMFTQRNRVCPDRNKVQAMAPACAEMLDNPRGTAPGLWMPLNRARIACLPGPPREMQGMFHDQVVPRLRAAGLVKGVRIERRIHTFGQGESAVEERLGDITARGNDPEVGITASDAVITLRIFSAGVDEAAARKRVEPIEANIRELLGPLVYGADEETLAHVVLRELDRCRLSLALAEGVTGGALSLALSGEPWPGMRWFHGGVVARTPRAELWAGLQEPTRRAKGSEGEEAARELAEAARLRMGTDLGLATVGRDDEGPGAGQVWVALSHAGGCEIRHQHWFCAAAEVRSRTAKLALDATRLFLAGQKGFGGHPA